MMSWLLHVLREIDYRIILVIIILVVIGCCCCCCYFIGKSVYRSNSTPVTVQTVRTVEITPSNKQFYMTKTTPFNQPSSNRLSIPSAPPFNNYPSIPDAPPSINHPSIPNDAPPKYSEAIQTSVKTPPSGETTLWLFKPIQLVSNYCCIDIAFVLCARCMYVIHLSSIFSML